jgi:hypothetical protein
MSKPPPPLILYVMIAVMSKQFINVYAFLIEISIYMFILTTVSNYILGSHTSIINISIVLGLIYYKFRDFRKLCKFKFISFPLIVLIFFTLLNFYRSTPSWEDLFSQWRSLTVTPMYEELIYRYLIPNLINLKFSISQNKIQKIIKILIPSIMFTYAHRHGDPGSLLSVLISGIFLNTRQMKNESVIETFLIHCLNNVNFVHSNRLRGRRVPIEGLYSVSAIYDLITS